MTHAAITQLSASAATMAVLPVLSRDAETGTWTALQVLKDAEEGFMPVGSNGAQQKKPELSMLPRFVPLESDSEGSMPLIDSGNESSEEDSSSAGN